MDHKFSIMALPMLEVLPVRKRFNFSNNSGLELDANAKFSNHWKLLTSCVFDILRQIWLYLSRVANYQINFVSSLEILPK